jgi:hypothetical protein
LFNFSTEKEKKKDKVVSSWNNLINLVKNRMCVNFIQLWVEWGRCGSLGNRFAVYFCSSLELGILRRAILSIQKMKANCQDNYLISEPRKTITEN